LFVKNKKYVCVAQLDRALGYGPRCREFESSHARGKRTLNLCLAEIWGLFII
jgi:hypothetical protein